MPKDDKRKELIRVASAVFSRFGFEKTTLEDIGQAAQLNKATLYYYFKNKEELFIQVVMDEASELISVLQKKVIEYTTYEAKIINYLLERLVCYEQALNIHAISLESRRELGGVFKSTYQEVLAKEIAFLAFLIHDGIQVKEFISVDSNQLAETMIVIADAIKKEELLKQMAIVSPAKLDYSSVKIKLEYALTVIMNGIKRNRRP